MTEYPIQSGIYSRSFEPTYRRPTGLWVVDTKDIPLPEGFILNETSLVRIPPGVVAGNHKHPRIEAFVGMGDLEFGWIDSGNLHTIKMDEGEEMARIILVYPNVPHAVRNLSLESTGVLYELANSQQYGVEMIDVFNPQSSK